MHPGPLHGLTETSVTLSKYVPLGHNLTFTA